jgi:hypothetical protein
LICGLDSWVKRANTMLKRQLVLTLGVLVMNLALSTSLFAATDNDKVAKQATKVKANIARLGTGRDARIEVQLRDKTKLKGYVSQIKDSSFFVVDDRTGTEAEVPYSQTRQVKGHNLSTGAKIAIAVGIIAAIIAFIVIAGNSD